MRRTTADSKDRTNVHSKQLCVPFRIFFRVGNDSSFGILVVGFALSSFCEVSSGLSGTPWNVYGPLYEHGHDRKLASTHSVEIVDEYKWLRLWRNPRWQVL